MTDQMIRNNDFEALWKKGGVVSFNALCWNFLEGTGKTTKLLNQDSRYPGRSSNRVPPEYKSEAFSVLILTLMYKRAQLVSNVPPVIWFTIRYLL
jgi:hypothetical protein